MIEKTNDMNRLLQFCLILCWIGLKVSSSPAAEADLILHNGKIVTVDNRFSVQQAIAIRDGRIMQVAKDSAVLKLKSARTEMVDLNGCMVLPGLMDSHTHPTSASMTEFDHPIPDMESIRDVLDYFT